MDAFRTLATDPRVVRYISNGRPWEEERIAEFVTRQIGHQERLGYCCWRLLPSRGDRLIGFCGLQPHTVFGGTEIGWWLEPDQWGQGFATEVAREVVRFAWDEAQLEKLIAVVHRENDASAAVARKVGMEWLRDDEIRDIPVDVFGAERPA